ncbi:MAG TPA: D-alanine--D-alanine ligase [Patescibacteria group bacterium]|nr:D-alanine--D-alanine ligase [Patescibacteria group bacterium]
MKKIKVGIIFGGKSSEHEISIMSARNVFSALDPKKYEPLLIGISKNGKWYLQEDTDKFSSSATLMLQNLENEVRLVTKNDDTNLVSSINNFSSKIDVVFPVLHGTNGEDGTVQGLLKLAGVPFVGSGVLGSAIGMDKDVAKRLLRDAGILIAKFIVFRKGEEIDYAKVVKQLGLPMFVKPANNGSSIGISKVKNKSQFSQAIRDAFRFDRKILIEEAIKGREIECSVLGNGTPKASIPGEIITTHEFYDYEAKYFDKNGARTEIPAKLSSNTIKLIQETACRAFQVLNCEGMARVDFFVTKEGKVYVNEINTIPGFTNISMYPKLWEASGVSYSRLIDELIDLAIKRFEEEKKLQTTYA